MHEDRTGTETPLFLKGWRPFFFLLAAGFLLYAHTLSFGLTWFDDNVLLLENGPVLSGAGGLARIFSTDVFMSGSGLFYRPLLNVSFMLDTLLGGPGFAVFHLTNILLHALSACLLFTLLLRLKTERTASFLLSLIFLTHPALTQAVAWIPGRNDSLLFIFAVLSFLSFLRFLERGATASLAGYIFFFLAALFTKETAIVLPLPAALYIALLSEKKAGPRAWLLFTAGSAAAAAVWLLARSAAIPGSSPFSPAVLLTIAGNSPAALIFLGKTVFPLEPGAWTTLVTANPVYGIAAAALIFLAALFAAGKRRNLLYFGLLWFLIFLIPSLTAVKGGLRTVFIAGQRLYLPLAGFLIFLSGLKWFAAGTAKPHRLIVLSSFTALLFAIVSFTHSHNFSSPLFFWENAVQETPSSPEAHLNLGLSYYLARSPGAAERHYRLALALNGAEPMVHNNLGIIYADRGNYAMAEKEFEKELEINPRYSVAAGNLRLIRRRKKQELR